MTTAPPTAPARRRRVVVVNWRDLEHSLAGGSEITPGSSPARCTRRCRGRVPHGPRARPGGDDRSATASSYAARRRASLLPATPRSGCCAAAAPDRRRDRPVVRPAAFSPLFVRRSHACRCWSMHHVHQDQFATHFPAPVARLRAGGSSGPLMPPSTAERVVAVSESTVDEMRRQLGWRGPVGLLDNGADLPPLGPAALRQDLDRVVVLGRLVAHKRVDLVLRAVDALRTESPAAAARRRRQGSGAAARSRAWPPARSRATASSSTASSTRTPSGRPAPRRASTSVRPTPRVGARW